MTFVLTQAGVGSSQVWQANYLIVPAIVTAQGSVTGTATYTIEYTLDDILAPDFDPNTARWTPLAGAVTNATGTAFGNPQLPMRGVRLRVSSGTGTVVAKINQYGTL